MLTPATALALALALAGLPAAAVQSTSGGGGTSTGASTSPDSSPSAKSHPDWAGSFSGVETSRQISDYEGKSIRRLPPADAQHCVAKFKILDKNSDGMLSSEELERVKRIVRDIDRVIKHVDKNRDGRISSTEFESACTKGL
jgi:Ca2+-binding EF-hand superfamily protein